MFSFPLIVLAFSLFSASIASPSTPLSLHRRGSSSTPLPPSQDPWYTAPADFESSAPGTILRIRPVPGNLTSIIGNCSAAYNILFRSTNSRYAPTWGVTTLFVPQSTNSSSLLSYQIPYNTADVDGSPSYALYQGGFPDIPNALGLGWYVNVPDFEGPYADFTAGVQEGHATLDSVRAALHSEVGPGSKARYALWGYSGGSLASEWAAELQVQYAPELNISGLAAGGVTTNLTDAFLYRISGGPFAGLVPGGILGITKQWPEAYQYVLSRLKTSGPHNRTGFLQALNETYEQSAATFANQDIFDYFIGGRADLEAPVLQKIYNSDAQMGYHGVPQTPMFFYKAIADELVLTNFTTIQVERYCQLGANILYQLNTVGGHLDEYTNGVPRAFAWLSSVFDGTYAEKYPDQGCTTQTVSVNITDTGL
ncbi:MAG: hypothetical protein M1820_009129 [Bogoriella megaspora]|nr:MAG: hypothetical protein M1820_009129 [Bogoriella megaspora]